MKGGSEMEIDTIYNMNCLKGMKEIADGSVDMILCDLPYGITDNEWDVRLPFEPLWEQYKRVTKNNAAIVLFSQMPFGAELIMSNKKMFRYEWILEKGHAAGFLNSHKMPLRCHENILVFYNALPTYNPQLARGKPYKRWHLERNGSSNYGKKKDTVTLNTDGSRYPRDVVKFNMPTALYGKGEIFHPTQKPVALCEYLIRTYTNEGELVLDNCMGSGTTAVAAINTGRHFIGFEKEKKYFDIALKRIEGAKAQIRLDL